MEIEEAELAALWLECLWIFHFQIIISYFYLVRYRLKSVFSDNGVSKKPLGSFFSFLLVSFKKIQKHNTHPEYSNLI